MILSNNIIYLGKMKNCRNHFCKKIAEKLQKNCRKYRKYERSMETFHNFSNVCGILKEINTQFVPYYYFLMS